MICYSLTDRSVAPLRIPKPTKDTCGLVLSIRGQKYRVHPEPARRGCTRAFAISRRVEGGGLVVYRIASGPLGPQCDCPASKHRPEPCKHVRAALACGLLDPAD